LVFGSFVSGKPAPRDVDVVLVMIEAFRVEDTPREARTLFSHADAEARYGASIFWVRDGSLRPDEMAEFLETWQTGRDGRRRGLLEIVDDRR
jgi:predicted nucleotidyltransferase